MMTIQKMMIVQIFHEKKAGRSLNHLSSSIFEPTDQKCSQGLGKIVSGASEYIFGVVSIWY